MAYLDEFQAGVDAERLRNWKVVPAKAASRKLTIQLGDRQGEVRMMGHQTEWDPVHGPLPEWKFSEFVSHLIAAEPRADLSAIKVQREVDGKTREWTVDLRPQKGAEGVKPLPATLADGDRVSIALLPATDAAALAERRGGIYRVAPGCLLGERVFRLTASDNAPRTLCEVVAESYQHSRMVVPQPDLARIRIHRLKADGSGEETLEVDLVSPAAKVSAQTPGPEVRKLDVPLIWGDIVEFGSVPKAEIGGWTGLSGEMRLFLRKALTRLVTVLSAGHKGVTPQLLLPVFADYEGHPSNAGVLWKGNVGGQSPFRVWSVVRTASNLVKVRIRSKDSTREFTPETIGVNPWLVEGDQVEIERY
jgi:hypothetical protein